jgi:8-hydroxy-5-deazaflavin:NADPH oxidoreductase
MRYGVLGTGNVGRVLAGRLVEVGHEVRMGSRTADNEAAAAWAAEAGPSASHGTFADAAEFGQTVMNCTAGGVSLDALAAAGAENLSGKVLIDVANALTFETGRLTLTVCNTDSLGEQIQRAFPDVKVVKTLNTMTAALMADPALAAGGDHSVFVSGDDEAAKHTVSDLLERLGHSDVIDLGDLSTARGTEMLLPIWLRLMGALGTPMFNFKIAR